MTQLSTALVKYEDSLAMVHTALYSCHTRPALVALQLLCYNPRAYAQLGDARPANADPLRPGVRRSLRGITPRTARLESTY